MTELVFVPLGGVGEIGMNFALYGWGPENDRQWMIVDCGVTFPGPDLPGIDLVLPDVQYIIERREALKGIVITHAHEDHYGALLALYPLLSPEATVPVLMTDFAAGMLESKAAGDGMSAMEMPVEIFKPGSRFDVGPFNLEAVAVTHSIPEPVSLAIRTSAGTVLHTGDWKNDTDPSMGPLTDASRFRELGDEGVLALICDSTNAMRDGESPSEREVSAGLRKVILDAEGRVAVTTFSSNVGRIKSIAMAAAEAGRQTLLLGRSMKRVVDVADQLGYMEDVPPFVTEEEFGYIPRDKAVIILTGSQGEPRAALAKLSRDEMRNIALSAGDTVVYSSRNIPGNEKPILETINRLIDMGIRVVQDGEELVHVSGHPRRSELRQMYDWARPKIGIPVHGEAAHLSAHAALMREEGVPTVLDVRNGDVVKLAPGEPEIGNDVPHGRIFKDAHVIGDEAQTGVADRRRLSFAGHVVMSIILNRQHEIANDPQLVAIGVPPVSPSGKDIDDLLYDAAIGAVESMPRGRRKDLSAVEDAASRAIRASAREHWGKKPLVTVLVDRI
ncbi:MAG: ribonuclease J [Pseudomonadota bacterium]